MLEHLAIIAKSIANPHRLAILEALFIGEYSVEGLAEQTGLTIANTSQHLQHLKRAGLVQSRKDGKHSLYSVGEGPIGPIINALKSFTDFQFRQFSAAHSDHASSVDAIDRDDLLNLLEHGNALLLDVRPEQEFALGRLPGAINIPVDKLKKRLAELPKNIEIVAYCRGPLCNFSKEATALLRENGYQARCFEENIPLWQAAGLPLDLGNPHLLLSP